MVDKKKDFLQEVLMHQREHIIEAGRRIMNDHTPAVRCMLADMARLYPEHAMLFSWERRMLPITEETRRRIEQ